MAAAAAKSRVARESLAVAYGALESPAHRWRAPVRQTLKSHRNGQRWSLSAGCLELPRAVSGCLAPAATFFHRPGDYGCFLCPCPWGDEQRAPRRPETERGVWRLIATDEWIDVTPVPLACQEPLLVSALLSPCCARPRCLCCRQPLWTVADAGPLRASWSSQRSADILHPRVPTT